MAYYCTERLQSFQNLFQSDFKQKKTEFYIELRRQKRESVLFKNRGLFTDPPNYLEIDKNPEYQSKIHKSQKYKSFLSSKPLPENPKKLKKIIKFLKVNLNILSDKQLLINCLQILMNLTLNSHFSEILNNNNFVALCLDLLDFNSKLISEYSIWCLSNLSVDIPKVRLEIIESKKLSNIILLSSNYINDSLGKVSLWCLTNIIRGRPIINSSKLPILFELFVKSIPLLSDQESLIEILWALERLTSNISATLGTLIDKRFLLRICRLINNLNYELILPCLKIINNLIKQRFKIREIVACRILDLVVRIMSSENYKIIKEGICIVNQLTVCEAFSIEDIVKHEIVKKTMKIICHFGENIKIEVADFLSNLIHLSDIQSLNELINKKIILVLCSLLESSSNQVKYLALQGLYEMFKPLFKTLQDNEKNLYIEKIENCSGLSLIEKLVYSNESHISDLAIQLIDMYKV